MPRFAWIKDNYAKVVVSPPPPMTTTTTRSPFFRAEPLPWRGATLRFVLLFIFGFLPFFGVVVCARACVSVFWLARTFFCFLSTQDRSMHRFVPPPRTLLGCCWWHSRRNLLSERENFSLASCHRSDVPNGGPGNNHLMAESEPTGSTDVASRSRRRRRPRGNSITCVTFGRSPCRRPTIHLHVFFLSLYLW